MSWLFFNLENATFSGKILIFNDLTVCSKRDEKGKTSPFCGKIMSFLNKRKKSNFGKIKGVPPSFAFLGN